MNVKPLTEHHLDFISLKVGCTGSPESILVKMPHCWKSHVTAHICLYATCKDQQAKFKSERTCLTLFVNTCQTWQKKNNHKSDTIHHKCPRQSESMFPSKLEFASHSSNVFLF